MCWEEYLDISEMTSLGLQVVTFFFFSTKLSYELVFLSGILHVQLIHSQFNLLKPIGYVMHQQFNIQQLYALPTPYLCVLCLSEDTQRLVLHTT